MIFAHPIASAAAHNFMKLKKNVLKIEKKKV